MSIPKKEIIDDSNLTPLLKSIFSIIDKHYVRKTQYDTDIQMLMNECKMLADRIGALESLFDYQFSLSGGELTLTIQDWVSADVEINEDGDLILTEDDDETTPLEYYSFTQTEEGDLLVSITGVLEDYI